VKFPLLLPRKFQEKRREANCFAVLVSEREREFVPS
jgi:hypothetical protein